MNKSLTKYLAGKSELHLLSLIFCYFFMFSRLFARCEMSNARLSQELYATVAEFQIQDLALTKQSCNKLTVSGTFSSGPISVRN